MEEGLKAFIISAGTLFAMSLLIAFWSVIRLGGATAENGILRGEFSESRLTPDGMNDYVGYSCTLAEVFNAMRVYGDESGIVLYLKGNSYSITQENGKVLCNFSGNQAVMDDVSEVFVYIRNSQVLDRNLSDIDPGSRYLCSKSGDTYIFREEE